MQSILLHVTEQDADVVLLDDDMKMSKHVRSIDYIKRHCCAIYFCGINFAYVDYHKSNITTCFDLAQVILRFIIDV
jgi:hypothetical protein